MKKTLEQWVKFYTLENSEQLFNEMSNCLEMEINSINYEEHLENFYKSYAAWIESNQGE